VDRLAAASAIDLALETSLASVTATAHKAGPVEEKFSVQQVNFSAAAIAPKNFPTPEAGALGNQDLSQRNDPRSLASFARAKAQALHEKAASLRAFNKMMGCEACDDDRPRQYCEVRRGRKEEYNEADRILLSALNLLFSNQ
jgi:hypothetical protein